MLGAALHLEDLARSLTAPSPRGAHYMGGRTDLYLGRDQTSPQSRMVARHEATHARLTSHTSYGLLLRAVALDALSTGQRSEQLTALLDATRQTQEVAATAIGAWTTSEDADELLRDYPAYHDYHRQARAIAAGATYGSYGAVILVEQVCRVAMQMPLLHLAPDPAKWANLTLPDLPPDLRPDTRLDALLDLQVDLAQTISPNYGHRPAHIPPAPGPDTDEFLRWYYGQSEWVFNHAAALLRRKTGATTASFNGQALESAVLADGQSGTFYEGGNVARVHINESRPPLAVTNFTPALLENANARQGLVVARPLARLLDQYAMTKDAAARLHAAADDGVVLGLRRGEVFQEHPAVHLAVLQTPRQLEQIADTDVRLVASICSSVMYSRWARKWLPPAHKVAYITTLVDSDLDDFTEQMRISMLLDREARPHVESGMATVVIPDAGEITGVYLRVGRESAVESELISLAICDPDTAVRISRFWQQELATKPTRGGSTETIVPWLLRDLIAFEPWFDLGSPLTDRTTT